MAVAKRWASELAIVDRAESLTYGELAARVRRRRDRLSSECHMSDGSRVALLANRDSRSIIDLLALFGSNVIITVIDKVATEAEQRALNKSFDPHFVVTGEGVIRRHTLERLDERRHAELGALPDMVFATSGTTGEPKMVAHSQNTLLSGLWSTIALQQEAMAVEWAEPTHSDRLPGSVLADKLKSTRLGLRFGSFMAMSTIGAFTMLQRALMTGEALILIDEPTPDSILDTVQKCGITNLAISPFVGLSLIRSLRARERSCDSLIGIGIGGGLARPEIVVELELRLKCTVISAYGSTETAGPVLMSRPSDSLAIRSSTVGRPMPGSDFSLEPEMAGQELMIRSPSLMLGYWSGGSENAIVNSWYRTGDLASCDDSGNVSIIGRRGLLINRGGNKVDPVEVESTLEMYPGVKRAGVVGTPSRVAGEQDVFAFVVIMEGAAVNAIELRRWCSSRLALHKVPRKVRLVESLPTARDGRIQRGKLSELAYKAALS